MTNNDSDDIFNREMDNYLDGMSRKRDLDKGYNSNGTVNGEDNDVLLQTYPETFETEPSGFDKFINYLKSFGSSTNLSSEEKEEIEGDLEKEYTDEVSEIDKREEQIQLEEKKLEKKKESVIKSFLRSLKLLDDIETSDKDQKNSFTSEEILDDLKIVGKISIEAIKKMPKDQLEVYKNSDDFLVLKATLKKHNIVKEN